MPAKHAASKCVGLIVGMLALTFMAIGPAFGHCDTVDGPVVKDAQYALDAGDVTHVLKWVSEASEDEVRQAFQRSLVVRGMGDEARELADMYFFETVVRLHRASEGAPYTGLKPAGTPVPAVVARSDEALETGNVEDLARRIAAAVETGIRDRFAVAVAAHQQKDHGVDAGRQFVAAYVEFVHYIEAVHDAAIGQGGHHGHEAATFEDQSHLDPSDGSSPRHEH